MTNLEKLTAGEIAAENNGTLEQLQQVINHCFPNDNQTPSGDDKIYRAHNTIKDQWIWDNQTDLPTITITQLWEELQALKKPEIWWIRVTEENKETLEKWFSGSLTSGVDAIAGRFKTKDGSHKGTYYSKWLSDEGSLNFGNEIDFPTFLKYTGVEVVKPQIVLPEKWGGEIEGLPAPILKRMMECQVEQGNKADYTVFENWKCASKSGRGFDWSVTAEKSAFWTTAITYGDYSRFFEMYPETKPEKVEKSLEMPPQTRTVEQVIYDKLKVILDLNNERINLNVTKGAIELAFYNAKDELEKVESQLTEINTKLSALLK